MANGNCRVCDIDDKFSKLRNAINSQERLKDGEIETLAREFTKTVFENFAIIDKSDDKSAIVNKSSD